MSRLCQFARVDLIGIADLNEARGQEVAARYETTCYRDYGQLLPKLDAVTIATTTDSHFDLAKACLEQGLRVMVEKPITETIEQAQQLPPGEPHRAHPRPHVRAPDAGTAPFRGVCALEPPQPGAGQRWPARSATGRDCR